MNTQLQTAYLSILREELVPATGCTEPIALAYAAPGCGSCWGPCPSGSRRTSPGISSRT